MKRLLLILAAIVATGGIAATPAVAGLAGNPSFSHQIPVPVPSQAQSPRFADDHGRDGAVPAASPSPTRHAEPGDDRGGDRVDRGGAAANAEHGDDRGGSGSGHAEPGDDHGGASASAEPGDDHGGTSGHGETGDDHGGRHGRG